MILIGRPRNTRRCVLSTQNNKFDSIAKVIWVYEPPYLLCSATDTQ